MPGALPAAGRLLDVAHACRALLHGVRDVVAEQRGDNPGLAPGSRENLGVVRQDALRAAYRDLRSLALALDAIDLRLSGECQGLDPGRLDQPGSLLAAARGGHGLVQVSAQAPDVRELQVDGGRRGNRAGLPSQLAGLGEPCGVTALDHVDRPEFVQGVDPPHRELLAVGDLGRPLEGLPRGSEVTHPLPPADHLERLERDLGGPACKPSRLGARQRTPGELLSRFQVA